MAVVFAGSTVIQADVWRDSHTLWLESARRSPNSWEANYNLGGSFGSRGEFEAAERSLGTALALAPHREDVLSAFAFARLLNVGAPSSEATRALRLLRDPRLSEDALRELAGTQTAVEAGLSEAISRQADWRAAGALGSRCKEEARLRLGLQSP